MTNPSLNSLSKSLTNTPFRVVLIGGGNSGHVCASLIHSNTNGQVIVDLLTSHPEQWSSTPKVNIYRGDKKDYPLIETVVGKINKISSSVAELIPNADLVLWTGPVCATKSVFSMIAPFVSTNTVIGTIFAQGLTHLIAHNTFGPNVKFFALRNIPWLCRTILKGKECEIVGPKTSIEVATMNITNPSQFLLEKVEPLFYAGNSLKMPSIVTLPNFLPIVFNPANQIIHPSRYFGIFRDYSPTKPLMKKDFASYLYRGMDESSGELLSLLDEELQSIYLAYQSVMTSPDFNHKIQQTEQLEFPMIMKLKDRILFQYGEQVKETESMAKIVGTNSAYSEARTPHIVDRSGGIHPDPRHRVVSDDIGHGLCVLISIADSISTVTANRVQPRCEVMKMLVNWHQKIMNKSFLVDNQLNGRDCNELELMKPNLDLRLVATSAVEGLTHCGSPNHNKSMLDFGDDHLGNP